MIFGRMILLSFPALAFVVAFAATTPPGARAMSFETTRSFQEAGGHGAEQESVDHAAAQDEHAEEEEAELDAVHHNMDSFYLDFAPFPKVELPRIFLVRREGGAVGVDFYGSTHAAVESGDYIAYTEEGGHAGILDAKLEPAKGEILVDFSITKHLFFAWMGMFVLLAAFLPIAGRYKKGIGTETAPRGKFHNAMEALIVFVRDDIVRPSLGDKADKYFPYLLTVFLFILTCNFLGLLPFGATATSNLMVTATLALFTFVYTMMAGTKDYWKHIFWPPGIPVLVKPILIPVEILGLFTKPFALAIRLFANMTAGHLVILSLIGLIFSFTKLFGPAVGYGVVPISVAFSLFIFLLEILVAIIQAYVFTMLSALFIGMAIVEHHHEEGGHGHDAHTTLATVEAAS